MKEIFVFLFFALSIPTLMVLHLEKDELQDSSNGEKFVTINFSIKSVEVYNKIMDEVGIAMSVYRGALATKQIKQEPDLINQFKKDNKEVIEKLNKILKLSMRSKSKEDFFNNIHNMTLVATEYEFKYNLLQKDKQAIRKKYYDFQKNISENEL